MTTQSQPSPHPRRREGDAKWIPWLFVGFFAVVIAANAVMVALALESWTGISTENAYEKGLAYNHVLNAARAQERLGWQADIALAPAGPGRGRLAVNLHDHGGKPVLGARLVARFVRPTSEGFDTELALADTGPGVYAAEAELALPGQWDVVVTADRDGSSYQATRRVFLPQ